MSLEQGSTALAAITLHDAVGDAVIARIALLAQLDVASPEQQLGTLRVRAGTIDGEFLVIVRMTSDGLAAEIRRMAGSDSAGASTPAMGSPPAGRDSATVSGIRVGVYRIHREVGRGGMGVVYRAEHEALGKPVAIKVLYADMARDPETAARFVREARAASRARHPGIVDVTDFGTLPDGRAFLVMELIEGVTLDSVLNAGALPAQRAVGIARQIAAALEAAHAAGVVHRDLKPANVFVAGDDQIKIVDFGAAKVVQGATPAGPLRPSDTQKGSVLGTPHYMSPEHARGLMTDRRTDVYALGCVLYEMLSGAVPYDGENAVDVLTKHITAPVPPVDSPHGPVPEILERTVARAMAKRVEERYQTAREMLGDLDRAQAALARSGWRKWLPV